MKHNFFRLRSHFSLVIKTEKCYVSQILYEMYKHDCNCLYLVIPHPLLNEINGVKLTFKKENVDPEEYG